MLKVLSMDRKTVIKTLVKHIPQNALIVSANGYISRELFSAFDRPGNFYMLGSMGMCLPIALGLTMIVKRRKVVVFDGDGNVLMNMGSMSSVAKLFPKNLVHIVIDNEAYESTGGQPSSSRHVSLDEVARACKYRLVGKAENKEELDRLSISFFASDGPSFLLAKARDMAKPESRISLKPEEIAKRFMKELG